MREWGKETWARERRKKGSWLSLKLAGASVCSHSYLHGSQLDGGYVGGVHHGLGSVGRVRQQALPLLRQAGELLLARVEARVHAVLEVGRGRDLQPLLLLPEHDGKAVETWKGGEKNPQKNRQRQLKKTEENELKHTSVNIWMFKCGTFFICRSCVSATSAVSQTVITFELTAVTADWSTEFGLKGPILQPFYCIPDSSGAATHGDYPPKTQQVSRNEDI